ncbi:MAG TPA: hypothetical protein VHT27_08950 [Solirubrobacteraceae bacterium]|jgi:hypothetical protein|nr:hypothetical protein [Solirubrobacteraceae bacterium]
MHSPRRHPERTLLAATPILAAALLVLGGCGGSSKASSGNGLAAKSPEQIVQAAQTAARGAATVHISGSTFDEKEPISLNMELVAGKGAKGHITLKGLGVEVVEIEHAFYIQGSSAFYRSVAGPAAAQLLAGKWLKAPSSTGEFARLAQLTDLGALVDRTLSSHGALSSSGTATIAGQKAVGVTDSAKGGTLYVAATGTPYPLEIVKKGQGAASITFDRWNQPVTLDAPAHAININQLQNGA